MKSCRLIIVSLVVAMASCAVAKEAILFLNAHPDDTDGFAGTAYLLKDKYEIHVVDLTRGELGLGPAGLADGSTAYRRTQEETKAQAYYGAKLHFLSEVFKHKRAILSFYECQNQDGYLLQMTEKRARWRGRQRVPAVEYAEPAGRDSWVHEI